jgi:hypothetical protein
MATCMLLWQPVSCYGNPLLKPDHGQYLHLFLFRYKCCYFVPLLGNWSAYWCGEWLLPTMVKNSCEFGVYMHLFFMTEFCGVFLEILPEKILKGCIEDWQLWNSISTIRQIFVYTLFSEPSDIQKWWFGIKIKFYFYFLRFSWKHFFLYFNSTLLYIILTVKYGAPKQAKHEQINVFRPVSEQNLIAE